MSHDHNPLYLAVDLLLSFTCTTLPKYLLGSCETGQKKVNYNMYKKSKHKRQSQQSRINEMQKEIDELKSLLSQLVEKQS